LQRGVLLLRSWPTLPGQRRKGDDGQATGAAVANYVLAHALLPLGGGHEDDDDHGGDL
jgi:hypothetical protein